MGKTIFKAGKHRTISGQTLEFSEADLAAVASAYDATVHEAPVVYHKAWGKACRKAGITMRFYDIRHIAASEMPCTWS